MSESQSTFPGITLKQHHDLYEAAVAYADCGFSIVQLKPLTKQPQIRNWPNLKLTLDDVMKLWHRTPYNIGISTSGMIVVDIDPAKGGEESLLDWHQKHGREWLDNVPSVVTGTGGGHYYFQLPEGRTAGNREHVLPGIDIRAHGGQVVAPPSIHPDTKRTYEWDTPIGLRNELPVCPGWLADIVTANKWKPITDHNGMIQEGTRNATLFVACCRHIETFHSTWEQARAFAAFFDAHYCAKRQHPNAVEATARSAFNTVNKKRSEQAAQQARPTNVGRWLKEQENQNESTPNR